ncbi:MAG: CD225/dispanin family protein [Duncaniella sp.]|nr:CD225/dispanin family protein [Muribaculum sp.]MCM1255364.1 CD225/dispanin family protein [Duncaniella sp.]
MKYWIIINNVQVGPKSLEELREQPGLSLSTPIWHEGLADWTTVAMIPEIASWFNAPIDPYSTAQGQQADYKQSNSSSQGAQTGYQQPYGQQAYGPQSNGQDYNRQYNQGYGQPYGAFGPGRQTGQPPMPNNYLIWAIITTICCCIVTGIVAIVYASKVSPAYYSGNYLAAQDASNKAEMWVIISFVLGLIVQPFYALFSLMSV